MRLGCPLALSSTLHEIESPSRREICMFRSRYFCDRVMIVIFCSLWYRMVSSLSEVALLHMVAVLYYSYRTDVFPVGCTW